MRARARAKSAADNSQAAGLVLPIVPAVGPGLPTALVAAPGLPIALVAGLPVVLTVAGGAVRAAVEQAPSRRRDRRVVAGTALATKISAVVPAVAAVPGAVAVVALAAAVAAVLLTLAAREAGVVWEVVG